jgi:ATP-dependent Lhr-like helicase
MNKTERISYFHAATSSWLTTQFGEPTQAQREAWPAIAAGQHTLIAAPTGSGKTLAAFLAAIDRLVRQGVDGRLADETQIVYVSPLKALSNDIEKNLRGPLEGIRATLRAQGFPDVEIRTWVRTGDTPSVERQRAVKRPPHIIVTTPESLYILLGSKSGRGMLATTRTVIVDEIHALAPNKRGAHLSLTLERLTALCGGKLQRIGLGATQKPVSEVARYLVGNTNVRNGTALCKIIDTGHIRKRDLGIAVPPSPLEAVMSGEQWQLVYDMLAKDILDHRTTLIFVNTRRMVERVARALSERIGEKNLAAHHGSLSREQRLNAEQRLKAGELKALVATASLELGIDIGEVDLVCQLGSPRSISSFLQRVGRSGHAVSGTPKGRLYPLSRDELIEAAALLDSVRRGELDYLTVPSQPLDVLAQQIVAETAADDYHAPAMFKLVTSAWPYRKLSRDDFLQVVRMVAEGYSTRRGRRGALIHYDAIHEMLRARRGAQITALTSGGAIPDNADYRVLLQPENHFVGTVHEDFAVESLAGDIFQLGNQSYRILRVERGVVRVEDAHGQPPTIPFWIADAPGRSDELSAAVSRLRHDVSVQLHAENSAERAAAWLQNQIGLDEVAAGEAADYLTAAHNMLGALPTQDTIIFERFFDESGGMQFVIHSPFGSRINRAWGLALRKRFCRKFNFELQAAATEDNIVISLSASHSFELADVQHYLRASNVREILTEAILDAPMFATRWRWVAATALALPRFVGGKKRPPQLARMDAEDLVAAVFPDQLACAENAVGAREIPDHPLVRQTIDDCLHEAMDVEGLEKLLSRIETGAVKVLARDLAEPSLLAQEVLAARPYAYLDDAPIEERRTQAVQARRWTAPEKASDLGRLDPDAITRVKSEVWPGPRNPEELHDALVWLGFVTHAEASQTAAWPEWLAGLARDGRATRVQHHDADIWVAAERIAQFEALWPAATYAPAVTAPVTTDTWTAETALIEIVRGRLEGEGPVTETALAQKLGISHHQISAAVLALQTEGFAIGGLFSGSAEKEWCDRRLLARIHRYTIKRLRAEIEPVSPQDYMGFLLAWQRVTPDTQMQGADAVSAVLQQLEGFEAPAAAWETEILPSRISNYKAAWLDQACTTGRSVWTTLRRRDDGKSSGPRSSGPIRSSPISILSRRQLAQWLALQPPPDLSHANDRARQVLEVVRQRGALFYDELLDASHLMPSQLEDALGELAGLGLITSDSFAGLRALLAPADKKRGTSHVAAMQNAGRWALVPVATEVADKATRTAAIEHVAGVLLRRYGVVVQRLMEREASWMPPWRDLLSAYRRLEDRGDIRGGRFVAGFAGEQFALPEAIGALREVRRKSKQSALLSLSGADPLNLVGITSPGAKLPSLTGNRVLYRDGVPIALMAGQLKFLEESDEPTRWAHRKALLQGPGSRPPKMFRFQRVRPATRTTLMGTDQPPEPAMKPNN